MSRLVEPSTLEVRQVCTDRKKAPRFSLGGSLSIFNGLLWICLFSGGSHLPEWALTAMMPLLFFLSLPFAFFFLIPGNLVTFEGAVIAAVAFGVNAFIWGHSLAWGIRFVGARFGWIPTADQDTNRSSEDVDLRWLEDQPD